MLLVKGIVRGMAYLLAGVLTLVLWILDLLGRVLSFAGVFVILLFLICIIAIAVTGSWSNLPIVLSLMIACVILFFGTAFVAGMIQRFRSRLLGR